MSVHSTVVFTDLIGSTGVFEALGNAKATQVVREVTQWIASVCESNGGRVVKTMGDGVLALFPSNSCAIDAVVEMQRKQQQRISQSLEMPHLPIRIGVASGDVEIVADDCYGDAVNVASRLSDLSGAHQIWASSAALEGVREPEGVRFRVLGPIHVRGRAEPCSVHQIEWHEESQSDFLTMQAALDPMFDIHKQDVLGGQIELSCKGETKTFRSFDLPIHIGRVRQVEFSVNDPRVSRTHARIDWRNGCVMLVDVSSYGCWVRFSGGGSDLLLRRDECVLHGRGEIALGASFSDQNVPTVSFQVS